MPSILGVYEHPVPLAEVARRLRNRGYEKLEVYSPAAFAELENVVEDKPSGVRIFTLIGGLLGVVTGYAMTIWMANDWPIMIGGKPFSSIPPYTIIAFELTILFGGIATLLGLLLVGKLPYGSFGKGDAGYSARFSAEDFGIVIECDDRDIAEIDALLRAYEAKEISVVSA